MIFFVISRADTNIDQIQITNRIPILLKKKIKPNSELWMHPQSKNAEYPRTWKLLNSNNQFYTQTDF